MINKRNLLFLLLFSIILIGAISSVDASDLNTTEVQTAANEEVALEDNHNQDDNITKENNAGHDDNVLKQDDSNPEVSSEGPKSFNDLYELINNNTDSEIVLKYNYTYNSESDGNYRFGVPIMHNVTIDGRGCIIDGGSIAKGFSIDNCNVVIKNVTFSHLGQFSNSNSNYNGGAVFNKFYVNPETKVKVIDSTFTGCKGYWGGALYNVEAENCIFTQNSACYAGAMYMTRATDCTFKQNSAATNGGACYNIESYHCTFISNSAASYNNGNGGGQYRGTATNCEFRQNSAKYGGGFYGSSSSDYALNCKFISNTATNGAGAYSSSTSNRVELVNCEFRSNEAYNRYGGSYACKRVLCTYSSNKAKNGDANYDTSSPTGYAQLRVPSSCEVEYPSPVEIPVNITYTTANGKVLQIVKSTSISLYKDGSYMASYSCMSGSTWIVNLERGSYRASFSGGSSSASCNINVCVNKTKISTNGTNQMLQFDDEYITATLTNITNGPLAGFNVTVFDGQGYSEIFTTDKDGQIRISLKNISYGYHQFTIKYDGNEFYEAATAYHTVNIRRISVNINSLSEITTYYNKTAILTGNLTDEYGNLLNDYNLSISVNNINYQLSVDDSQFKIEIPLLLPQKYQMYVAFDGNKTHSNVYKIVNVVVNRIPTEISSQNVRAFYREGKVTAVLLDRFGNTMPDTYLNLFMSTDFIQSLKTNGSGEVEFDVTNLDNGTYHATVTHNGSNIYLPAYKDITIRIGKLDAKITTPGASFIYNETGTLIAYLTETDGTPIKNAEVRLEINSINETVKTDGDGTVEFDLTDKLSAGTYNGNLYFDTSERYEPVSVPVKVNADRIPIEIDATNVTCFYNENAYLIVTLKDKYGRPIKNGNITIKADVYTFTGITNESGEAKISVKLPAKSYLADVTYEGDETHAKASTNSNIVIKKVDKIKTSISTKSVTTVFNENSYLVATLKDANGKAIANSIINIQLNGKTYKLKTDGKGQVKLNTNGLAPKTYSVTIKYLSNDKYIGSSYSTKILVKKATPKITSAAKQTYKVKGAKNFNVVLKDSKNKVMKNQKVSIKFKGKTYVVKTNSKGQATFKFTNLNKKGTYKAVISFAGNSNYKGINKAATFVVK